MSVADSERGVPFLCFPEICRVWAAASKYIRRQLLQKRVSLASCSWPALAPCTSAAGRARSTVPRATRALRQPSRPCVRSTANAASSCLHFQAVHIGVGTFAVVPVQATVGEDKVLPVERPVFRPCRFLKKFYKLRCAKTKIPGKRRDACPAQSLRPLTPVEMWPKLRGKRCPAERCPRAGR